MYFYLQLVYACERERECERVCVCVCVRERETKKSRPRVRVCAMPPCSFDLIRVDMYTGHAKWA